MDKIHAMQLFVRVAELESFSRAAESLTLPKGSVSRQIQALENRLGTQLLHRTTRRVSLTQDGMVYYERAKDLLTNLDELDGMFQHDPSTISGRLRVDMPVSVARNLVIPKLPAFLQQYPGIELELSSSDRLVDVIREGFDCVVRVGALKDSGLIARPLGKLSVINCASRIMSRVLAIRKRWKIWVHTPSFTMPPRWEHVPRALNFITARRRSG